VTLFVFFHFTKKIEANRFVASVSDRSIQYTAEYKIFAVKENLAGKGPVQIFKENGFDLEVIGVEKARSSIKLICSPISRQIKNKICLPIGELFYAKI